MSKILRWAKKNFWILEINPLGSGEGFFFGVVSSWRVGLPSDEKSTVCERPNFFYWRWVKFSSFASMKHHWNGICLWIEFTSCRGSVRLFFNNIVFLFWKQWRKEGGLLLLWLFCHVPNYISFLIKENEKFRMKEKKHICLDGKKNKKRLKRASLI